MSEELGISAGVEDGYVVLDFDWEFDLLSYPFNAGAGSGRLVIDDLYVTAAFRTVVDGDVTTTEVTSSICSIGDFELTLASDDINTTLINILAQLLSPVIADYVGDFLGDALGETIVAFTNSGAESSSIYIDERVALDYHAVGEPVYTDHYEALYKTGFYFLTDRDAADVPFDPPALPDTVGQGGFQLITALDCFQTAWWCYAQLGYFADTTSVARPVADDSTFDFELTVAALAALAPALEGALPLDTALEVEFECAFPDAIEPLYSGVFVRTGCDVVVETADAAHTDVLLFEARLGLAEQPQIYGGTNLGLTFFYHNHTLSKISSPLTADLSGDEASTLFHFISGNFIVPFLVSWGEHISFTLFDFDTLAITTPNILFTSDYAAASYDVFIEGEESTL